MKVTVICPGNVKTEIQQVRTIPHPCFSSFLFFYSFFGRVLVFTPRSSINFVSECRDWRWLKERRGTLSKSRIWCPVKGCGEVFLRPPLQRLFSESWLIALHWSSGKWFTHGEERLFARYVQLSRTFSIELWREWCLDKNTNSVVVFALHFALQARI